MSVILATFRRPAALRSAVGSLERQSRPPEQVVLAAWTEDEETLVAAREIARSVRVTLPTTEVTIVTSSNHAIGSMENEGISAAGGDIVCFIDDDAVARPDWLARIEMHYSDPRVGAVGGRDVVHVGGELIEEHVREVGRVHWFGRLVGGHHNRTDGLRDVDFLKGCNMSFRRGLLVPIDRRLVGTKVHGFEIDLGLAVRERGLRVLYDPRAIVDHFPTSDLNAHLPELAYTSNHNQTYILLKRLPMLRKLAFLAYTFLVGDKNTIGILRVPFVLSRREWTWGTVVAHFRGKFDGVRTYVAALSERGR